MFELINVLMKRSIGEKESTECSKSATLLKFQRRNILDVEVPAEGGPAKISKHADVWVVLRKLSAYVMYRWIYSFSSSGYFVYHQVLISKNTTFYQHSASMTFVELGTLDGAFV